MSERFRNFVFTWNNYPSNHEEVLRKFHEISFIVYQPERGDNGTDHLQGYIELQSRVRFNVLRKWAPWHIEKRRGTQKQAIDYATKSESAVGSSITWGTKKNQGKRKDIEAAYEAVREKKSKLDIAEDYPKQDAKYFKALDRYRTLILEQSSRTFRHLCVKVFWGDAGTGKTRRAVSETNSYYILNEPGSSNLWWDGYEGQETLIIDDFSGWIKYRLLLKILDGYQLRLSIKGGFTYAQWKTVIMTSNKPPKEWYQMGMTPELSRRLNEVTHFSKTFNIN